MVTLVGCGVLGIDLVMSIYNGSVKFNRNGLVGLLGLGLGLFWILVYGCKTVR